MADVSDSIQTIHGCGGSHRHRYAEMHPAEACRQTQTTQLTDVETGRLVAVTVTEVGEVATSVRAELAVSCRPNADGRRDRGESS